MNTLTTNDLHLTLEQADVAYWQDYFLAARGFPETAPYVDFRLFGEGVVAGLFRNHDILAFNRCLGLGLSADPNPAQVAEVSAFYEQAGIPRFFVPVFPGSDTPGIPSSLERAGILPYNRWAKLFRHADQPLPDGRSSALRLRPASVSDRAVYAHIISTAFDWPAPLGYFFAAILGRRGWYPYLAMDGAKTVAVGALYVTGEIGVLAIAATLPDYRNRGAQNALIQHRIRLARVLGCRYLSVETAEDKPDTPCQSYQNLRKHGFELAYLRPNYLKRFAD
ncbi:GNAT family N-acetyltransferase [Larkinella sp. VNQ87]|uniref:GNAT family N-acetyltransferase n=1 Tax=Larkinella sp. VNQ87 TaxID=3400921 RepID=UPI003BFD588D